MVSRSVLADKPSSNQLLSSFDGSFNVRFTSTFLVSLSLPETGMTNGCSVPDQDVEADVTDVRDGDALGVESENLVMRGGDSGRPFQDRVALDVGDATLGTGKYDSHSPKA
jgi:hypothetical protein